MNETLSSLLERAAKDTLLRAPVIKNGSGSPHLNPQLGRLSSIAARLLAARSQTKCSRASGLVFAGRNGVAGSGVSSISRKHENEMLECYEQRNALVQLIGKRHGIAVHAVNVGLTSKNFVEAESLTWSELRTALRLGWDAAIQSKSYALAFGELGAGNTTTGSVIAAVLLGMSAEEAVGPGAGIDAKSMRKKTAAIRDGIHKYGKYAGHPARLLKCVGGPEICALTGGILSAASHGCLVFLDGLVCSVAAAVAAREHPEIKSQLVATHLAREPAHRRVLAELGVQPLMHADLAYGQGVGSVLGMGLGLDLLATYEAELHEL